MTKEQEEGNEIIAKYCGAEYRTDLPYEYTKSGWINTGISPDPIQVHQFRYHRKWDELVPVLTELLPELKEIYREKGYMLQYIAEIEMALLELDIEKVFSSCVQAITELNKIKDGL